MYIQPAVEQAQLMPMAVVLTGSPVPAPDPIGVIEEPVPSGGGGD